MLSLLQYWQNQCASQAVGFILEYTSQNSFAKLGSCTCMLMMYLFFTLSFLPEQSRKPPTESFQVSHALRGLPPSWCRSRSTLRLKGTNCT